MDSHILILLFVVVLVVGILWNNRAAIFGMAAAGSYVVARGGVLWRDIDSEKLGNDNSSYQNFNKLFTQVDIFFSKYGIDKTVTTSGFIRSRVVRRPSNKTEMYVIRQEIDSILDLIDIVYAKNDHPPASSIFNKLKLAANISDSYEDVATQIFSVIKLHQENAKNEIIDTIKRIEDYKFSNDNLGFIPIIEYMSIWINLGFYDFKHPGLAKSLHNLKEALRLGDGNVLIEDRPDLGIYPFSAIKSNNRVLIADNCAKALAVFVKISDYQFSGMSREDAEKSVAKSVPNAPLQISHEFKVRQIDTSPSSIVARVGEMNSRLIDIESEAKGKADMELTVQSLATEVNLANEKYQSENAASTSSVAHQSSSSSDRDEPAVVLKSEYVVPRSLGNLAHQQVPESKSEPTVVRIIPPAPDRPAPRRVPESKSEPSIVKKILHAPARDAPRRILTAPPLEPDEDSLISIPKKIGRMLYPPGYVPYRYRRARTESDDEDSDDYNLSLNPRDCENVARYRARYGKDALVNELVRQLHEFPGTNLLTRDSISTMDPAVHIKHYMSSALKHSRLSGERSPAESWSHENSRRKFFDTLVTANPKYCVNNTDLWSAADKFLKYVPIAPVRAISDLITKYDPRQILDVNVMFGSSIAALALATPQSAMYTGLCKSGFRLELGILANRISGRSTFPARITLLSDSIMDYRPTAGFDMIICEIRARGSEILPTGVPESQYSDTHSWLTQYVDPILTKISAAMTTGAHVIFMTTVVNPDTAELWKHIGQKYTAAGSVATTSAGYSILTVTKK